MLNIKLLSVLLCIQCVCYAFIIPKVTLEAYEPAGFRASIPAENNTELFAFHGKLNEEINQIEPGDFSGDIKTPKNGYFTYYNPNLELSKGDVVHYWYFVQNNQLGYRKDGQKWTVTEKRPEPGTGCIKSSTKVSDRTEVCSGAVIFEDNFATLDEEKWTWEQYMPATPDFEFVLYKKDPDVTFINSNQLCIKPKLRENEAELKKIESISVELGKGCTREALCYNTTYRIKNPVISGRLESKVTFSYGAYEIKAQLPSGDWIYPAIYLEDQQQRRIFIAYARGNQHLTGNDGDDLGNSLLFGGPLAGHREPERSKHLKSYRSNAPLSESSHIYKLRWTADRIELFLDGSKYGEVGTEPGFTGRNPGKFRLVLGVGAGGLHDFPDGYKSTDYTKPWQNGESSQVVKFFNSRKKWYETWSEEGRQLKIEYVKVTAT